MTEPKPRGRRRQRSVRVDVGRRYDGIEWDLYGANDQVAAFVTRGEDDGLPGRPQILD